MKNIEKPSAEELHSTILQVAGEDLEVWASAILPVAAKHLKLYPIQYRNYGPYWWVMKKALIDAGYEYFGDEFDAEMLEAMSDSDKSFAVFRAMLYYDYTIDNDFIGRATHTIVNDGEDEEYTVYDDYVERQIASTGA